MKPRYVNDSCPVLSGQHTQNDSSIFGAFFLSPPRASTPSSPFLVALLTLPVGRPSEIERIEKTAVYTEKTGIAFETESAPTLPYFLFSRSSSSSTTLSTSSYFLVSSIIS